MSDIHDDASRQVLGNFKVDRDVSADVLVVAGDIAGRLSRMGRSWLEAQCPGRPIVAVAGNHDFWRGSLDDEIEKTKSKLLRDDVHILDGSSVVIGGTRFVGATLWTDYEAYANPIEAQRESLRQSRDFDLIRTDGKRSEITPRHLAEAHDLHLAAIEAVLSQPFDGATVVVTHHAPSLRSLDGGRATDPTDAHYASDLEALIRRFELELWVHGHVHRRLDYRVGRTRVVCNPRGYEARWRLGHTYEDTGFDPRLVVNVRPLEWTPFHRTGGGWVRH